MFGRHVGPIPSKAETVKRRQKHEFIKKVQNRAKHGK